MTNTDLRMLFTPLKIKGVEIKNRIVLPPMRYSFMPYYETMNDRAKNYYIKCAQGGVGLMVLPATGWARLDTVHPAEKKSKVFTDENAAPHKELVKILHSYGVKVGILAVYHRGRQSISKDYGYQPVAPSAIPWKPSAEVPRALTREEIANLVERAGDAAKRAMDCGFDMAEVFASHGYLLGNFLSPAANKRTDEYGGDVKGRARFMVEIVRRMREKVGPDYIISCRINGADYVKGGITIEETVQVAPLLVEAGADMISISGGAYGSFPGTVPPYGSPPLPFVADAAAVKSVVNVPVVATGGIHTPQIADQILLEGKADLIAMGRPLIVDPDFPNKALRGDYDDIRYCIHCNHCLDSTWELDCSCTINASFGREKELEIIPAAKKKKVMIIGGGLAGMEAARVCALRGHQVALYEEKNELGGQWLLAAKPPFKQGYTSTVDYLSGQLKKLGVKVELGKKVTNELIEKQKPEVVIVATGGVQAIPPIPGIEQAGVVSAWDVLSGKAMTGNKVLVIGGGITGVETAELLAEQGKKVTVVEMLKEWAADMGGTVRWQLSHRLRDLGVVISTSTRVLRIAKDGIVVKQADKEETWKDFDSIVVAAGVLPVNEIAEQIKGKVNEVYIIGDARKPAKGVDAILQGTEVGIKV